MEIKKSPTGISPKKLSNLKVVVLCVAAATTFWILNALNKDDYTTIVDFPVEFVFDQEEYMAVGKLPSSVEIEISGNGWDLLRKYFKINNTPYPIELDNPSSKAFLLTSDLKRGLSEFLAPTQLISMVNDSLEYEIDQIQTVQLTPTLDSLSYTLGKNYRLADDPTFEPKRITLSGPSSILEIFEGTFPVQLNESRISGAMSKEVSLEVPRDLEDYLSITEETIVVNLDVIGFMEGNKRLKVKKINFPRTVTLEEEDPTIMMYYLVDARFTEELKDMEFEAILDYGKRNKQDSTISVQIRPMPEYLDQVRIEPSLLNLIYEND
ncbi:YbbR-like domain-containing protein [Algoriphagus vanfongensis]|uniref:YbbR-like domain-containing protein n=1 Tax=Algoriphagus vanfongensis TaxID=426371 RepID=UPI001FE15F41|nr:YbbR-like domain-containing protein [Algoriphagus vanfongensis]